MGRGGSLGCTFSTVWEESCVSHRHAQPTWFGFRPTASRPGSVDLVELTDKAVVTNVIGSVVFGNRNEYAWPNAVRCLPGPPAFCLLATTVADEASSTGNTSYVYSVSSTDAKIIYRTECPGEHRSHGGCAIS